MGGNIGIISFSILLQGLGNNTGDYNELVASLAARGISATVAQVSRPDWLRNAAGLLDASYWKGTLQPRPVLDWWVGPNQHCKNYLKDRVSEGSLILRKMISNGDQ